MQNVEVVQQIYQAFGRGDVPAVLEHLADDVEWEYGTVSSDVPWLQPRHGKSEVPRFFEALGALDFVRFEPYLMLSSGPTVVVLVNLDVVVRATGAAIHEEDEVHIWHFRDGKAVRFRHRVDTQQHLRAFRGELTAASPVA